MRVLTKWDAFNFINDPKPKFRLTWNMRLKIATDVAEALAYLHFASYVPIYHRDIKSTNILLDEKYVVKVSDFGISKLVEVDQTHLSSNYTGERDVWVFRSRVLPDKSVYRKERRIQLWSSAS